ncbi:MAG: hypothetical protein IJS52_10895 [Bacilli bacterium]|nr:hypothetical protein [Bacilli bacterium]
MSKSHRKVLLIALHLLLFLFGAWGVLAAVFNVLDCDHDRWNQGWKVFKFFTNDANIFASIIGLSIALFHIIHFKDEKVLPAILRIGHFVATCMLVMVLLTVVTTLLNTFPLVILFGFPSFLFLHTLSPLLCLALFLFADREPIPWNKAVIADIPFLIYAIVWIAVLLILNLPPEVEIRNDVTPYFFLSIHNQPWYISLLWFFGLLLVHTGIAFLLLLLRNRPWNMAKRQRCKS